MENSRIIPGMVFKRFVDSEVKNVKNAKIAVSTSLKASEVRCDQSAYYVLDVQLSTW